MASADCPAGGFRSTLQPRRERLDPCARGSPRRAPRWFLVAVRTRAVRGLLVPSAGLVGLPRLPTRSGTRLRCRRDETPSPPASALCAGHAEDPVGRLCAAG